MLFCLRACVAAQLLDDDFSNAGREALLTPMPRHSRTSSPFSKARASTTRSPDESHFRLREMQQIASILGDCQELATRQYNIIPYIRRPEITSAMIAV